MNNRKRYDNVEWLSDYLDNRLSTVDKAAFEKMIAEDQNLKTSLSTLQAARILLKSAPKRHAPHNFTISTKAASRLRKQKINIPILRLTSVFSTALSIIIFTFALLFNQQTLNPTSMMGAAPAAEKSMSEEASAQPQIILWGDQNYGMGGGGSGAAPFGKGGGGGDSQPLIGVESAPLPAAVAESEVLPEDTMMPVPTEEFSLEAPEESLDTQTSPPVADSQETNREIEQPVPSGSGPILGLDTSSSGEHAPDRMANQSNETGLDSTIWLISASALLLAGIITGIAALILNRKIT